MEKAIRFNPLKDIIATELETDWKVIDEFYTRTSVGPLLSGEVWKDTEANRETITKIIYQRRDLIQYKEEVERRIHQLMNLREK